MKRFFKTIICLVISLVFSPQMQIFGQNGPHYFYGVDFSNVKVYGVYENEADFAKAMGGINALFIYESSKYNVSKIFKQKYAVEVDYMINYNKQCDFSNIKVDSPTIPSLDIASVIQGYQLPHTSGVGAIIIARLLDKAGNRGVFDIVVFDIETRKILHLVTAEGEPGGYGLRNYWACSISEILRSTRVYY